MPISDEVLAHPVYRHMICAADTTIGQATAALREAGGQPWWPIVIDYGDGRYGLTRVHSLAKRAGLLNGGPPYRAAPINEQLRALAASDEALRQVEPDAVLDTVEQQSLSAEDALKRAAKAPGGALLVLNDGEPVGLLVVRATKRAGRFGPRRANE